MRKIKIFYGQTFFTIISLALIFVHPVYAEILTVRVVGVTDGDTITVLDNKHTQYKISLAGIGAPEKKQPFGQVSRKILSDLVFQKTVKIEWKKQDRYGWLVGKVLVDKLDVNLEQIKYGLAWFYKKYQRELLPEDRLAYLQAEMLAKESKLGLWVYPEPQAPWEFRKNK